MRLTNRGLEDAAAWKEAGIALPGFDRELMIAATAGAPEWVHFGAGNIFRAFPAALAQNLLKRRLINTGIVVAEGYDGEIIDRCFRPFDNLSLLVTLKADGTMDKEVIASVACALRMDRIEEYETLKGIFRSKSLQMASFTITEKAYGLGNQDGLLPGIAGDYRNGPGLPASYLGRVAGLCYERYVNGALPLAMVSMDNCSHNGDKLFAALESFALEWTGRGLADKGFLDYVRDPRILSFPWTMIDKITPRPGEGVRDLLASLGFEDPGLIVTEKNTYTAPFVNAEETQYLAIEDCFPNGRFPLEKAGVLFTRRETVDQIEKMKVCTCLNPLHTALAIFGCLLGFTRISDEMRDGDLVKLIEGIGYREGLPAAVDPGIINPREFIDQVVKVRFPNPFMPDTPQRIAADTSLKLPIRFGETLKVYASRQDLDPARLRFIPFVFAGWLRYLLGIDDQGKPFTVSPDPNYRDLAERLSPCGPGKKLSAAAIHAVLEPILSNPGIFGLNLYKAGLGETVERHFAGLIAGPGAVRLLLSRIVLSPVYP
ncbi:MAG: mannitol dehydrogenase family protein [Spirochaetaceae bacterium]|jgi:fructuronate reductase|nr:mannitol dehydrogenase family protein [Spirochaetaceae bacterium]